MALDNVLSVPRTAGKGALVALAMSKGRFAQYLFVF